MLGNHVFEISLAKKKNSGAHAEEKDPVTMDDITRTAKKIVTYVAIGLLGSYAASVILNSAAEVTVHKLTREPEPKE